MNTSLQAEPVAGPRIERVRHELKRRTLRVEAIDSVTPHMLRLTLSGDDLADFVSLGFDDHVKLVVPAISGEEERRDYTPRRFDPRTRTLTLDFAVHDAGPATRWALGARPGDTIQIGGPRGSAVIAPAVRRWLLVGDETALPAIGRRIEEAAPGSQITSVVAVPGPEDRQIFKTRAELTALWGERPLSAAADPGPLLSALEEVDLLPETFLWIAAEASVARALRRHLVEGRGHPLAWTKAAGYWVMGKADASEKDVR